MKCGQVQLKLVTEQRNVRFYYETLARRLTDICGSMKEETKKNNNKHQINSPANARNTRTQP